MGEIINKSDVEPVEIPKIVEETQENVILVDFYHKNVPPTSLEDMRTKIREYRESFAEEISSVIVNMVIYELIRAGAQFDTVDPKTKTMMTFVADSIESLYLYSCKVDHPLQELAEEYVVNIDDDSEIMEQETEYD